MEGQRVESLGVDFEPSFAEEEIHGSTQPAMELMHAREPGGKALHTGADGIPFDAFHVRYPLVVLLLKLRRIIRIEVLQLVDFAWVR